MSAIKENNPRCYGCGACESICPKKAITLVPDYETFLYPRIDQKKCVQCGLCEKTCPLNYDAFFPYQSVQSFAGIHRFSEVVYNSSSGGAFTALYEVYIQKGYKIYGVRYDENLNVVFGSALSEEECARFRKSKYVQSDYNDCYSNVSKDLQDGLKVLFSGTSCQCAALSKYLDTKRISDSNLVMVNVLCHGVPSQTIFHSYLESMEKAESSKIIQYTFKNKKTNSDAVNTRTAYVQFDNGHEYIRTSKDDAFLRGYYRRLFYRPSCYSCQFARKDRISDITIADAWNIEKINEKMNPAEGVSLILFNTEKSKEIIRDIKDKMKLEQVGLDWVFSSQDLFIRPTAIHKNRERFFKEWHEYGIEKAVFRCTKTPWTDKIIHFLKKKVGKR